MQWLDSTACKDNEHSWMRKFKPKEQKKRRRKLDSQINCSRLENFFRSACDCYRAHIWRTKAKVCQRWRELAGKLHD